MQVQVPFRLFDWIGVGLHQIVRELDLLLLWWQNQRAVEFKPMGLRKQQEEEEGLTSNNLLSYKVEAR